MTQPEPHEVDPEVRLVPVKRITTGYVIGDRYQGDNSGLADAYESGITAEEAQTIIDEFDPQIDSTTPRRYDDPNKWSADAKLRAAFTDNPPTNE